MSQATTTYEKILEAQNEQLRETVEKLITENDKVNKEYCVSQAQYNELHKDILILLRDCKKTVETQPATGRSKEYSQVIWSYRWSPRSDYWEKRMPVIYPILRKIWLDHIESEVNGMKHAIRNDNNGHYSYINRQDCKFPTEQKETGDTKS